MGYYTAAGINDVTDAIEVGPGQSFKTSFISNMSSVWLHPYNQVHLYA